MRGYFGGNGQGAALAAASRMVCNNAIRFLSILAEGVGFEPTVPLRARRFSRPVP